MQTTNPQFAVEKERQETIKELDEMINGFFQRHEGVQVAALHDSYQDDGVRAFEIPPDICIMRRTIL